MAWRGRLIILLGGLILSVAGVFGSSCVGPGGKAQSPRIQGDTLYVPEGFFLARTAQAEHTQLPVFTRFDQQYPSRWPAGIVFPEDTFILDPPLALEPVQNEELAAAGYTSFHETILIPLGNQEAVDYLMQQAAAAGLSPAQSDSGSRQKFPEASGVAGPDKLVSISLDIRGDTSNNFFKVYFDSKMLGYTYVTLSILP